MASRFSDHPRKRFVRESWDTPILRFVRDHWGIDYLYFGLPGPEAADIRLWRDMIRRVIAFEHEAQGPNPRRDVVELNRQLSLLGTRYAIYCGPMEEVVLRRRDYEGNRLVLDEFVTLYNLDFCNAITGRVLTHEGRRCLRFEALRALMGRQRQIYRETGSTRFVILLTVRSEFHVANIRRFAEDDDLPDATREVIVAEMAAHPLPSRNMGRNILLLRAFVFTCLREYLHGHNVASMFLPPVTYAGLSGTPMAHFIVICEMAESEAARPRDPQTARQFLDLPVLQVPDDVKPAAGIGGAPLEPLQYVRRYTTLGLGPAQ